MIGKWSTKNAMVMESCEDLVTLFEFWAEQCIIDLDSYISALVMIDQFVTTLLYSL